MGTRNVVLSAGEGFKPSHVTGFCRMIPRMKCLTLKMGCGAGTQDNVRLSAGSFRDVGLLATAHDGYMPFSMNDDDAHTDSCLRLETLVLDVREGFSAPLVRSMCFQESPRCLTIQSVIHGWTPAHLAQSLAGRRPMVMRSVVRMDFIGMVDRNVLGGCIFMPGVKDVRFVVPLDSAAHLYDRPSSLYMAPMDHANLGLSLLHGEQIAEIVKGSFPGATSVHVGIEWVGKNTPNTWWVGCTSGRAYLSWLIRELQQRDEQCSVVVDASTFVMMSLGDLPDASVQGTSGDWKHYYDISSVDACAVLIAGDRPCCSLSNVTLTARGTNERLTSVCSACIADVSTLL